MTMPYSTYIQVSDAYITVGRRVPFLTHLLTFIYITSTFVPFMIHTSDLVLTCHTHIHLSSHSNHLLTFPCIHLQILNSDLSIPLVIEPPLCEVPFYSQIMRYCNLQTNMLILCSIPYLTFAILGFFSPHITIH